MNRLLPSSLCALIASLSFASAEAVDQGEKTPAPAQAEKQQAPATIDYAACSEEEKKQHFDETVSHIIENKDSLKDGDLQVLIALADIEYLPAMDSLAFCYKEGLGIPVDKVKAFELYDKAAQGGYASSAKELALCCLNGIGTDPDLSRAVRIYHALVEKGDASCAAMLGSLYSEGRLGFSDAIAAGAWFNYGYQKGDVDSSRSWATCLFYGKGVSEDKKAALEIYRKLVEEHKDGASCSFIGVMYWNGVVVAEDKKEAMSWFRRGAGLGDIDSSRRLAFAYRDIEGEDNKPSVALSMFLDLAYQGDSSSMFNAAEMLLIGKGVTKDGKRAVELLEMAVKQGDMDASFLLACVLYDGQETAQDYPRALELFKICSKKGNERAAIILTQACREGKGQEADPKKAHEMLLALLKRGCVGALYELGLDFELGRGVEVNATEAQKCYEAALAKGDKRAEKKRKKD